MRKQHRGQCLGRSLVAVSAAVAGCAPPQAPSDAELLALDVPALTAELASGRVTAERVTRAVLARIDAIDAAGPALNAIIEVNPDALAIAQELDRRFEAEGVVGPLHGVPVAIKANIDTGDRMATTAGSLALRDYRAADDAAHIARLRAAGAVIVAKTNLSEWANFRSDQSTSGWSSLGGQTKNAYRPTHNPCGSSSGSAVAVAARIVPLAIGTETDGSIVCPSSANGVVGIKPTLGLISQDGIIPVAAGQDTAGPIARTVAGAAMLLGAIEEAGAATDRDLARTRLDGIRLGVVRNYPGAGTVPEADAAFDDWLAMLRELGAELEDPVDLVWPPELSALELETLLYEFHDGIDRYLGATGREPVSLAALIEFNEAHASEVMPHFGQELFEQAVVLGGLDTPAYLDAVAGSRTALRHELERVFTAGRLDALVAPTVGPEGEIDREKGDAPRAYRSTQLAAVSGNPGITVPAGLIDGLPISITFVGRPLDEARIIGIAAAFEHGRGPFPAPAVAADPARP